MTIIWRGIIQTRRGVLKTALSTTALACFPAGMAPAIAQVNEMENKNVHAIINEPIIKYAEAATNGMPKNRSGHSVNEMPFAIISRHIL